MVSPWDRRQCEVALANLVHAERGAGGADFGQPGLRVGRPDIVECRLARSFPERQQIDRDLLRNANELRVQRALDEEALGHGGIGLGRVVADQAGRDAEDVQDLVAVRFPTPEKVQVLVAEADVVPLDAASPQESGAPLCAAVAGFPVALDALEVGIRHELADADNPGRHAVLLPECLVIPFGHRPVAAHGQPGGLQRG